MKRIILALAASTLLAGAAYSQDATTPATTTNESVVSPAPNNTLQPGTDAPAVPSTTEGTNPVPASESNDDQIPDPSAPKPPAE